MNTSIKVEERKGVEVFPLWSAGSDVPALPKYALFEKVLYIRKGQRPDEWEEYKIIAVEFNGIKWIEGRPVQEEWLYGIQHLNGAQRVQMVDGCDLCRPSERHVYDVEVVIF